MNDVPLNCPTCSTPLDEFVCPHCEDGQDEEGNQCAECCGTNWLHIRQQLGKSGSTPEEMAQFDRYIAEVSDRRIAEAPDETSEGQSS